MRAPVPCADRAPEPIGAFCLRRQRTFKNGRRPRAFLNHVPAGVFTGRARRRASASRLSLSRSDFLLPRPVCRVTVGDTNLANGSQCPWALFHSVSGAAPGGLSWRRKTRSCASVTLTRRKSFIRRETPEVRRQAGREQDHGICLSIACKTSSGDRRAITSARTVQPAHDSMPVHEDCRRHVGVAAIGRCVGMDEIGCLREAPPLIRQHGQVRKVGLRFPGVVESFHRDHEHARAPLRKIVVAPFELNQLDHADGYVSATPSFLLHPSAPPHALPADLRLD